MFFVTEAANNVTVLARTNHLHHAQKHVEHNCASYHQKAEAEEHKQNIFFGILSSLMSDGIKQA